MPNYIKEEPAKFTSHIVSLILAVIAVARSFGAGITEAQTDAIAELATGLVQIVVVQLAGRAVRANVTPWDAKASAPRKRRDLVSIVLCMALLLPGCGLFNRVGQFLDGAYDEYGPAFEDFVSIVCGRTEARARGMSDVAAAQEMFCFAEEQLEFYAPHAAAALDEANGREEALRLAEARAGRAMSRSLRSE